MGPLLTFLLALVLTLQALAFAIALVARFWVLRTDPVVLHGIDQGGARDLVAMYVESVHDTRFGFPTGVFRLDSERSSATRVVARELNFEGSTGFRLAKYGMAIPVLFAEAASDAGCGIGLLALLAGIMFLAFFILPILFISVMEVILRALMRSNITATLAAVPGEDNAHTVVFELSGLSAFGAHRSLMRGLSKPVLPAVWGGSPLDSAREPWQRDRLNMVYAAGSLIAVIVAVAFAAASPHVASNTTAASYAGGVPESSQEAGGPAGASTTQDSETTTETSTTTTEESSQPEGASGSGSADAALPVPARTVELHFKRLGEGDYEGAFAMMSASYRSANPNWVDNRQAADPMIDIAKVGSPHYGEGSARVYIEFYARDRHPTTGSDTQCRRFSGFAYLIGHGSTWRYEPAGNHYTAVVEPPDDPNCHG
jgi:hypothetical protein